MVLSFIYEFYWVYYSDKELYLLNSVNGPIKIVFPMQNGYSFIGIIDLIIPGMVLNFALNYDCFRLGVKNKEQFELLDEKNIPYYRQETHLNAFLEHNDYILPSPGIDTRLYANYRHKFLNELDLVQEEFNGKTIAITGSVGKTTVTSLLSQIINHDISLSVYTGGNIGTGMLSLVETAKKFDTALLEVSSFQLESSQKFAPDLAIWTTFYPNHLDRHHSMQEYFDAKFQLIAHQQSYQQALIPVSIADYLCTQKTAAEISIFASTKPDEQTVQKIPRTTRLFFVHDDIIMV